MLLYYNRWQTQVCSYVKGGKNSHFMKNNSRGIVWVSLSLVLRNTICGLGPIEDGGLPRAGIQGGELEAIGVVFADSWCGRPRAGRTVPTHGDVPSRGWEAQGSRVSRLKSRGFV